MSNSQRGYFDRYASSGQPTNLTANNTQNVTGQTTYQSSASTTYNQGNQSTRGPITTTTTSQSSYSAQGQNYGQGQSAPSYQVEGRKGERDAELQSFLKWGSSLNKETLVSGSSDYTRLAGLKDAILELRSGFFNPKNSITITDNAQDELSRRFLLIEHEIDGLLRRRIDLSTVDHIGGERNLDFTNLLNEKENQIVELEKKIQNLEARLRKSNAREIELENKIVALRAESLQAKGLSGQKLDDAVKREAELERVSN